jgi:hypothetical protein
MKQGREKIKQTELGLRDLNGNDPVVDDDRILQ